MLEYVIAKVRQLINLFIVPVSKLYKQIMCLKGTFVVNLKSFNKYNLNNKDL